MDLSITRYLINTPSGHIYKQKMTFYVHKNNISSGPIYKKQLIFLIHCIIDVFDLYSIQDTSITQ